MSTSTFHDAALDRAEMALGDAAGRYETVRTGQLGLAGVATGSLLAAVIMGATSLVAMLAPLVTGAVAAAGCLAMTAVVRASHRRLHTYNWWLADVQATSRP